MSQNLDCEIVLDYLREHGLLLATAESCTAGNIITLLAACPNSGKYLDAGYVVYSPAAKKRLLSVRQETLDEYGLTSEEVAREMARGALERSPATVVVATTGVAGPDAMGGVPPGTVCIAWGYGGRDALTLYSSTEHFDGDRMQVMQAASHFAIGRIPDFHGLYAAEMLIKSK